MSLGLIRRVLLESPKLLLFAPVSIWKFDTVDGDRECVEEIGYLRRPGSYFPPVGVSEHHAFRAVWETFNDIWYPVAWISLISDLRVSKRAKAPPKTVLP